MRKIGSKVILLKGGNKGSVMWDVTKVGNIGFDGYIGTWILWIYSRYIGEYFYMNIDISEINKNTLKFMEIFSKSVKMTLIIKYIH